jgi:hypothetical protein
MAVSFIGGGNWSARRKPQTGRRSLGMKNNKLLKWPSNAHSCIAYFDFTSLAGFFYNG